MQPDGRPCLSNASDACLGQQQPQILHSGSHQHSYAQSQHLKEASSRIDNLWRFKYNHVHLPPAIRLIAGAIRHSWYHLLGSSFALRFLDCWSSFPMANFLYWAYNEYDATKLCSKMYTMYRVSEWAEKAHPSWFGVILLRTKTQTDYIRKGLCFATELFWARNMNRRKRLLDGPWSRWKQLILEVAEPWLPNEIVSTRLYKESA